MSSYSGCVLHVVCG